MPFRASRNTANLPLKITEGKNWLCCGGGMRSGKITHTPAALLIVDLDLL
jgi:hypothetical protein